MSTYTENDQILLGVMMDQLPQCVFYNKRGTLLNPTIVSDMGMLKCGEKIWYLVIAAHQLSIQLLPLRTSRLLSNSLVRSLVAIFKRNSHEQPNIVDRKLETYPPAKYT